MEASVLGTISNGDLETFVLILAVIALVLFIFGRR